MYTQLTLSVNAQREVTAFVLCLCVCLSVTLINHWRARIARVTAVVLCVYLCVCVCYPYSSKLSNNRGESRGGSLGAYEPPLDPEAYRLKFICSPGHLEKNL